MGNELNIGTRRIGMIEGFNPGTPSIPAALERSDRGIIATVTWSSSDDLFASWFLRDSEIETITPGLEDSPVSRELIFKDSRGSVMLVGCYANGFTISIDGSGSGNLWASAAIMGPRKNIEFDKPHGIRTDISGLRAWLGKSSWQYLPRDGDRPNGATIGTCEVPDIEIGELGGVRISLSFGRSIEAKEDGDLTVLADYSRCVTRSQEPLAWDVHMGFHRAMRDLLLLSRWEVESCREASALRCDDPLIIGNGERRGENWRKVVVPDEVVRAAATGYRPHLFKYSDFHSAGLMKWIRLRDEFARALDPVISSIQLMSVSPNALLAQTGPGLEALGYLLMLRDGVSNAKAEKEPLRRKLERIVQDLGDCLPFSSEEWTDLTCSAYNSLKHANRKAPDPVNVMNSWRECVLVVRAWVGVELGIPLDVMKERLSCDPQKNPYKGVS